MINSALKLLAALLSVLLLFIFPLSDFLQRQEDMNYLSVTRSASVFTDSIRDRGYVTPTMYNEFLAQLAKTGEAYEVRMEHYEKRYEPIYLDPLLHQTFQEDFMIRYLATAHEDIMKVMFPSNLIAAPDDQQRRYNMQSGDFFSVDIQRISASKASILQQWLLGTAPGRSNEVITAGGMVRNEAH